MPKQESSDGHQSKDEKEKDSMFLFEALVDRLTLTKSPCFPDREFNTCVTVECPSCPTLEICNDDPGASGTGGPFSANFSSGKSCLFFMKEGDINSAMGKFPIQVSVAKTLPCGCIPTKILLGKATIDMTKEFVQARKSFLDAPHTVSYEALKDTFHLQDAEKKDSGQIVMYLRISCFGNRIVTNFQAMGAAPSLGAPGGGGGVDRACNPPRAFQTPDDPCVCGAGGGGGGGGGKGGFGIGGSGGGNNTCADVDDPCWCTGPKKPKESELACRNTDQYCLHLPKGKDKRFEEVGMTMCGNELKIKVPAAASVIKKLSLTHCSMQRPYVPKSGNDGPCEPPCGKNQISLSLPKDVICCAGAAPQNTQFTCTTEGCTTLAKHGQQTLSQSANKQDRVNKDVHVLKIAKTALVGDRRTRLEMEMTCPKTKDKKLPILKRTANVQITPECLCNVRRLKLPTPPPCCQPCACCPAPCVN